MKKIKSKKISCNDGFTSFAIYDQKGIMIQYNDSNKKDVHNIIISPLLENDNTYHYRDSTGPGFHKKFNEAGFEIYNKDLETGIETYNYYDLNNNLVKTVVSNGFESLREYNKDGKEIHYVDTTKQEHWTEYDELGREVHHIDTTGFEAWTDYRLFVETDDVIPMPESFSSFTMGRIPTIVTVSHYRNSHEFEKYKYFDIHGNEIHSSTSTGFKSWKKYDENNHVVYHEDSTGHIYTKKYNENGDEIHFKTSDGTEMWYEYEYYEEENNDEKETEE